MGPSKPHTSAIVNHKSDSDADIRFWKNIDRLDVRPDDDIVKVRSTGGWELQIDLETGEIFSSMQRRSDIIESIHDGSWFYDQAKLWIFLPSAIIVTILWMTGVSVLLALCCQTTE